MPDLPIETDVVQFEDGYYYYWPEGSIGGFSSHNLRQIADQLDKMNEPWDKIIQELNL